MTAVFVDNPLTEHPHHSHFPLRRFLKEHLCHSQMLRVRIEPLPRAALRACSISDDAKASASPGFIPSHATGEVQAYLPVLDANGELNASLVTGVEFPFRVLAGGAYERLVKRLPDSFRNWRCTEIVVVVAHGLFQGLNCLRDFSAGH